MHSTIDWRADRPWLAGMCAIILLLLGMPLLDDQMLLGAPNTDIQQQFYASRMFGFRELAAGRIAQWNPHTYSGAPYLGSMQAAVLYPPNLIFLALPTALGINWSIALHLCLLAVLTFAWARTRGIGREGSLLAGCIASLGGASFLHIYAGHLSNICTMAWTPLVFMAIDGIAAAVPAARYRSAANWGLAGIVAVAMQIFAGHPQYLFYTGVAAVLYSALVLATGFFGNRAALADSTAATGEPLPPGRWSLRTLAATGLALCAFYPLGAALGAAQLLPGVATSRETIRSVPVPFSFAAMFGFPPENLLTVVAPTIFGDMQRVPYWGRCYLWEMCLFVGVVGSCLAAFAAWPRQGLRAFAKNSAAFVPLCMIGGLLILALGNNTPLFTVLYTYVPGFGKFRGISKFIFPASLFIAILAGMGFDRLCRERRAPAGLILAAFGAGAAGLVAGFFLQFIDLAPAMRSMLASQECYLTPAAVGDAGFQQQARLCATQAVMGAGATAVALGFLLRSLPRYPWAIHLLLALGVGELCLFASRSLATSSVDNVPRPEIAKFIAEHPGDYRVLDMTNPDAAMAGGYRNIWGYAPDLTRRYGEFMAFTQDMNPDEATPYVNFKRLDPLYRMLRLKYAFVPGEKGIQVVESPDPLPHAFLVSKYRVIKNRDAMFAAMREPSFDPRTEVLLEEEPEPRPEGGSPDGKVSLIDDRPDSLTLEVNTAQAAILVVTDAYARSWKASSSGGEGRPAFDLSAANYTIMAVPLPAGSHRLRIDYSPPGFATGFAISLATLAGALLVGWIGLAPGSPELLSRLKNP